MRDLINTIIVIVTIKVLVLRCILKILNDPNHLISWELRYCSILRSCRISSINSSTNTSNGSKNNSSCCHLAKSSDHKWQFHKTRLPHYRPQNTIILTMGTPIRYPQFWETPKSNCSSCLSRICQAETGLRGLCRCSQVRG